MGRRRSGIESREVNGRLNGDNILLYDDNTGCYVRGRVE